MNGRSRNDVRLVIHFRSATLRACDTVTPFQMNCRAKFHLSLYFSLWGQNEKRGNVWETLKNTKKKKKKKKIKKEKKNLSGQQCDDEGSIQTVAVGDFVRE